MPNSSLAAPAATRSLIALQSRSNMTLSLDNTITTIGREPGNDIRIRSRFVSRRHARIVSSEDGAYIEDLDSRNGVIVNEEAVARRRLQSGDFIRIGRLQLRYIDILEHRFDYAS
jgi:pSer/pThr/pTyr-binding forkhead associated (FHA) protein